jgi:hypothetical protein
MVRKIAANRITIPRDRREVIAVHTVQSTSGCRVQATIDDDGNVSDPECLNDSCDGECELKQKENGSNIEYWCDCN